MKFNKILIASLLLVILTVGAVSASDENATVDNLAFSEDIQVIEVDNPIGSFSNLSDEIKDVEQDDTLILKNDFVYDSAADDVNGILIDKSMVIDGDSHYIDASNSARVFDIQTDNLTLKNIVFKNLGRDSILSCNAYNCTFMGATVEADTLFNGNFHDCTFIDCHSVIGTKIFKGTAYNSSFINCTGWGGSDGVLDSLVDCTLINFRDSREENQMEIIVSSNTNGSCIKFKSKYDSEGDISFRGTYTVIVTNLTETSNEVNLKFSNNAYRKEDYDFGQAVPEFYTVDLGSLEKGKYSVFVSFSGDSKYAPCNGSTVFAITRNPGDPFTFSDLAQIIEDFIKEDSPLGHQYDRQGTLQLNSDFKFNPECDGDIKDVGIFIDYLMCIDGNGHYIDAYGSSKVLNLTKASPYDFLGYYDVKNIVFKNLVDDGLYVARAYNCTFIGGKPSMNGATVTGNLYDCTFIDCQADTPANYIFVGTANDCTFINCSGWCGSNKYSGKLFNCTVVDFRDTRSKSNIQIHILTGNESKYMDNDSAYVAVEFDSMSGLDFVLVTVDNYTREMKSCVIGDETNHWLLTNLSSGIHTVFVQFKGDEIYQPANVTTIFAIADKDYQPETVGNIVELINLIENTPEGSILVLDEDYKFINGVDNAIQINKAITIDGNNHTIDASRFSRIFNVTGSNVIFKNINFIKGYNFEKAGAIYWKGSNGVITQCSFNECNSLEGGAIYIEGDVAISCCNFDNCRASGEESCGGAIYCKGYADISSCNFTDCESTDIFSYGGAIYSESNATITDCNFDNCKASASQWAYAGAIYLTSPNPSIISYCNFNNCEASAKGGYAGAISASNTDIYYCNFNNCQALGGLEGAHGGAISFSSKYGNEISSCNFTNCKVISGESCPEGGAIYGYSVGSINNCIFINNSARYRNPSEMRDPVGKGSAIFLYKVNNCNLTNCIFENNSCASENAVYLDNSSGNMVKCYFAGSDNYYMKDGLWNIIKRNTNILLNNYSFTCNDPINVSAKLTGSDGNCIFNKTIKFVFEKGDDSQIFNVSTNEEGIAELNLNNLSAGIWNVAASFEGDINYCSFESSSNVVISANNPVIAASNVKVTYNAGSYYKITVYDADGKVASNTQVVIKIAGKAFKTLTTNENGVAKFKVTKVPGTYKLSISALGVNVNKTLTVKHLVTLKSATVKKSAKKLVLTATLGKVNGKYLKKKTVTFKFNGKTYKAKTNSKGVAKVTIKSSVLKKLKVGKKVTYQATYQKDTVKKTVKVKK